MSVPAAAPLTRRYAKAALILVALALLATEHLVHYPVALMSLLGLADLVRHRYLACVEPYRTLLVLFALLWLPMAVACVDAVNPAHTAKTVALYLHFLPAAWFVARACADDVVRRVVVGGTVVLVAFTVYDALLQFLFKRDLFGYPYAGGSLKGVFHPKQRLGLLLPVFAPLTVDYVVRRHGERLTPWLVLVPLVIVILASLKRAGWVMLVIGMGTWLVLGWRSRRGRHETLRPWHIAVVIAAVSATVAFVPAVEWQLETSSAIFSADAAAVDRASGYRLSLWRTGTDMFGAHWLNGVGPRGYRHVYTEHAARGDFWMQGERDGQTHPHWLLLEIAVETGVIGLAAYLVAWLIVVARVIAPCADAQVPVWLLGIAVAWFPLNTHLAFYGSYWSSLVWMLLGIGLAAECGNGRTQERAT